MHRRTILTGVATTVSIGLAGCTGGGGGGTAEPSATDTSTEPNPPDTPATLTPREACPNPGEATVSFDTDDPVSIAGCVIGRNGCTVPRLAGADYDARALTVVVAAVEERDEDEACTDALVNLGYEVDVAEKIEPRSVEVVHDDVDGRRTVVDVTR